jgi:hypothetical protein
MEKPYKKVMGRSTNWYWTYEKQLAIVREEKVAYQVLPIRLRVKEAHHETGASGASKSAGH